MARVSIEDCLNVLDNRFALVAVAASRTRQLMDGAEVKVKSKNKLGVTALREIAEGFLETDFNFRTNNMDPSNVHPIRTRKQQPVETAPEEPAAEPAPEPKAEAAPAEPTPAEAPAAEAPTAEAAPAEPALAEESAAETEAEAEPARPVIPEL